MKHISCQRYKYRSDKIKIGETQKNCLQISRIYISIANRCLNAVKNHYLHSDNHIIYITYKETLKPL